MKYSETLGEFFLFFSEKAHESQRSLHATCGVEKFKEMGSTRLMDNK